MTSPQRANERACAEKERLSAAVQDASDDILALQTHRWTSVNGGCFGDLMYIGRAFRKAHCKWEEAWQAYQSHVHGHGC